ncbi:MAG: ABC transporter substrate-binding protein [Candidatus Poribacteria bacterium]|nr:ABC transporter substrate-binding protein [Candidatus Poribacteria bacterium]
MLSRMKWLALTGVVLLSVFSTTADAKVTVAYSDWPGWVAWDIGIQKGWFRAAGVDVEFIWFDYVASMDAFAAGQVDAVAMTNGDSLVIGATAKPNVGILINDFSNGNDKVVAKPGIANVMGLKGKKVGVEVGFVSHLLLTKALESAGMKESDITVVNMATHETPQAIMSGGVDAIVAWQPHSGIVLRDVAGSKAVFTSANVPGLIYDMLCVSPESLRSNRADWVKVIKVWFKIANYIADEKNLPDILEIMSARVGLTPKEYAPLMSGTKFLGAEGIKKAFTKTAGLESVYGSSAIVDAFQVGNAIYDDAQKIDTYLDPSLVIDAMK